MSSGVIKSLLDFIDVHKDIMGEFLMSPVGQEHSSTTVFLVRLILYQHSHQQIEQKYSHYELE